MKTCETDGVIRRVTGHKVDWGPIKLFPIVGSEVPVKENRFRTQIILSENMFCEGEGTLAEMIDSKTWAFIAIVMDFATIRRFAF